MGWGPLRVHGVGPPSASRRLFTYVNEKLFSKPTYAAFINLLNNYERATGRGEHLGAQQLAEQDAFLGAVMGTAVLKELDGFLRQQSEPPPPRGRAGEGLAPLRRRGAAEASSWGRPGGQWPTGRAREEPGPPRAGLEPREPPSAWKSPLF